MSDGTDNLSFVVIGASGDLARKKIFPALFALYSQGFLPKRVNIFGFARTQFSDEEFRNRITENLTCRYVPPVSCSDKMSEFLSHCYYARGEYDSTDSFLDLYQKMRRFEDDTANRVFYMAIPPSLFIQVGSAIGNAGLVTHGSDPAWSRVVIEKPFGKDRESSDLLIKEMAKVFTEEQTYRIDHYLGKEVIENLMVLRFANLIFEPIWNNMYIKSVQIAWKEDIGVEGRGGYFDEYGIIRDVMQNHLLQMLALTAMEPPAAFEAVHIRDEKVKVLHSVTPPTMEDMIIGQYGAGRHGNRDFPAYVDDKSVSKNSHSPTFAACTLKINNRRWNGVPFLLSAGKGLNARMTEIRIQFREAPGNIFCNIGGCPEPNQLVIRVQPDEAIYFRIISKVPGLGLALEARDLDMRYNTAFTEKIPDAYENLLLEVIRGNKELFIRDDELAVAWDVFTPVLHEIDKNALQPEIYEFGSLGPGGCRKMADKFGIKWC
jgi:glucose-6-phosphate 1-dehydrogenase